MLRKPSLVALLLVVPLLFACGTDSGDPADPPDDVPADDGAGDGGTGGDDPGDSVTTGFGEPDQSRDSLDDLIDGLGFNDYLAIRPVGSQTGAAGYTDYLYSTDDLRCFGGGPAHVSVSPGSSNNVMIFLEGGGAAWPGGGFALNLAMPGDISFRSRDEDNPLKDWHFVYVPYCDASLHMGDATVDYDGKTRYHWGLRHTAAAVALAKELFPSPDRLLMAGSSAGGYGTFMGWAMVKAVYPDSVPTYVLNDSGTGFWDPDDPATFEIIRDAWNLHIPDACEKCSGTIFTYLYELFLEYDPQVRIGLFSSYRDWIISGMFLGMGGPRFESVLLGVADTVRQKDPDRFKRFFVNGISHTTYEFLLPGGPRYEVDGVSFYEWVDGLVNESPDWPDLME